MTVQEKIDAIKHRKLDLSNPDVYENPLDNPAHRPALSIWAGLDGGGQAHVVLMVASLWGQASRFVELHPDEARKLARFLIETANTVDHVVNGVALDRAGLVQQLRDCPENAERSRC